MKDNIEWSDKNWKKFIVEQRKRMWLPDTIEKFAKWLDLKQGMKVADIGCGLGYLGWTYWKYFGKNGSYIGVDISEKLIKEAKELSEDWAKNGKVEFKRGDSYNLNFEENSIDFVMCQTLLLHLDKPEIAIKEMKRILKPGGTIFCMEPDNYSNNLLAGFSSIKELTLDEQLINHKIHYYKFKGKKKLNKGDHTIGNKLPMLFHQAGFTNIDIRKNDIVRFMNPPYEMDFQKRFVREIKKIVNKENNDEEKFWRKSIRKDVLAGGGSEYLLRKYFSLVEKRNEAILQKTLNLIEQKQYFSCRSTNFYAAKATKNGNDFKCP